MQMQKGQITKNSGALFKKITIFCTKIGFSIEKFFQYFTFSQRAITRWSARRLPLRLLLKKASKNKKKPCRAGIYNKKLPKLSSEVFWFVRDFCAGRTDKEQKTF